MDEWETRALRADASRNRDRLLKVASRVFVSADAEPSMRAIAREAGVGIGTLYRHFPTRESLVEAVYRDQVAGLTAGARDLLAQLPPPAALRRWMDLFGNWIATKNGMLDTLLALIESGDIAHARKVASQLRTGNVHLNGAGVDLNAPFGGYKQSGTGREWGEFGFEEFLEVKAVMGYAA